MLSTKVEATMSDIRQVTEIVTHKPTMEGAGVRLNRVFGFFHVPKFDPFLLLDDFGSNDPADYMAGFPWHPHRGIETVTYMLSGRVEHGDSLGNKGVIGTGDVQWMTAGSGIIHQEMPERSDGWMRGLQLWVNLPAANKMMDPRYRDVAASTIPEVVLADGIKVKVIAGEIGGVHGPVQDVVASPAYLDFTLKGGASLVRETPADHTAFAYVIEGSGEFDDKGNPAINTGQLALFGRGSAVKVTAGPGGVRFVLVSGLPLGEPVAWYGPIVMNTDEEIHTAFEEYRQGTFVKA
jgi:quercetin 2,3-dioxygenase